VQQSVYNYESDYILYRQGLDFAIIITVTIVLLLLLFEFL